MEYEEHNLLTFLKKNWIWLALAGMIILSGLFFYISFTARRQNQQELEQIAPQSNESNNITPTPTYTVELQAAVDEAKKSASEYNSQQDQIRAEYPWLRKLPYTTQRFYVYFNLEKNMFIGKLYPQPGDNIEQMKSQIISDLKTLKEIPADQYKIEWILPR